MKTTLSLLLGALLLGVAPSTSHAETVVIVHHGPYHRHHAHRVWVPARVVWRHGHRIVYPGHYVWVH